jgi:drug/metabolite transporter (DMT)-like permease
MSDVGKKEATVARPSLAAGRALVVAAAVLWSLSGAFTKVLTQDTWLHLQEPKVAPLTLALYRVFFPVVVFLPFLRRKDISFRPAMIPTALVFAVMNALFVSAVALGTAANAIFLQYTAPMWMYLAAVFVLREPPDRRGAVALVIGLAGIAIIVASGMNEGQLHVVLIALGSGIGYAGVLLGLRVLRRESALWLNIVNWFTGAVVLLPWVLREPMPTLPQFVVLFLFGTVQFAMPYLLMTHGLRTVSPQEAGTLTLIEPILNPIWAYLVSPGTENLIGKPALLVGGCFIVGALAYRYWPWRR